MAEEMKFLRGLPVQLQAEIMEHFSKDGDLSNSVPIEIDGEVHMISRTVSELIDSLTTQLHGLSED